MSSNPADINKDGVVNAADQAAVLGAWGPAAPGAPADVNRDGVVNAVDLALVTGAWGARANAGWTDFPLAPGARQIHVSQRGNDERSGATPATAVRSIARAYQLARDGHGDHVLFERSEDWGQEPWPPSWSKSGESASSRMVIGGYGPTLPLARPIFGRGLAVESARRQHLAIVGLHLQAPETGATGHAGVKIIPAGQDFIVEDCFIAGFQNGLHIASGDMTGVAVRRNVIVDCRPRVPGHSQGMLIGGDGMSHVLIEGNVVHRCGRGATRADATQFNHAMYLSQYIRRVIVRDNIVSEASSNGISCNGDAVIEGNLVMRCAVGIFARSAPAIVRRNVVMEGVDINADPQFVRGLGVVIGPQWYNQPGGRAWVYGNIIAHKLSRSDHAAITIGRTGGPEGACSAMVRGNVVHGWRGPEIRFDSPESSYSGLVVEGNSWQRDGGPPSYAAPAATISNHFLAMAVTQSRARWDPDHTAAHAIEIMRKNFTEIPA